MSGSTFRLHLPSSNFWRRLVRYLRGPSLRQSSPFDTARTLASNRLTALTSLLTNLTSQSNMLFFKNAFTAVAVVALGVVGAFAQSENVVVTGIQSVTTASSTLQLSVSELTLSNFPVKGVVSDLPLAFLVECGSSY